ncbi:Chaperone DnaJ-domain superfamily protein [Raphanus sativus]|nr:Chaperone DnaJ-domain superfamily protein [Raphanus sativus]
MNAAVRAAILRTESVSSHLKAAFFHSTPVLERKRRTSWDSEEVQEDEREQELLRNVNAFAANMFTSWHDEFDYSEPSSKKRTSWFKKQYAKEPKGKSNGKHNSQSWGPRNFDFCEVDEDFDIDYIFPGGPEVSLFHSPLKMMNLLDGIIHLESSDSESDSEPNQASHRQALGLSPSGPLNLKDVKHAYRVCALKWHPDRHQGCSTKEAAEAKFKLCSVAYQSLCEKLSLN